MTDPTVSASGIRVLGREALALLLSATCPGCDEPGTLLCDPCRGRLQASPVDVRTPQGRVVRAALTYEGVAARCIRRMKDDGETLLARPLGVALAVVLSSFAGSAVSVVPVPTSGEAFRRRGYRVPELLIRRAGVRPLRALSAARARRDQRGLDASARARNAEGSVRARLRGAGVSVVLVDDVITTGATLDEASLVLDRAGFDVVAAVALAATPLHGGHGAFTRDSSETRRK
ncbi:ComF family protein [Microbacterium hydrocarbonoxydans]|uniref:ComF family protein n=1 Tax=Microbacterium hydrocarbonoxydans TaxID=273678 RepID=UPI00203E158F|nr:ComF family protein [Microbacterium hydrocarbonoxydans]MCM3779283.1 ComF family protein [Microbacterium hydrocarbonoxydans]